MSEPEVESQKPASISGATLLKFMAKLGMMICIVSVGSLVLMAIVPDQPHPHFGVMARAWVVFLAFLMFCGDAYIDKRMAALATPLGTPAAQPTPSQPTGGAE